MPEEIASANRIALLDEHAVKDLLPACCELAVRNVAAFDLEEQGRLRAFLPTAISAIVLGHHVQHSLEWMWFPFATERSGATCGADLHLRSVAESVKARLESVGHTSVVLPYPDPCGVQFKTLAAKCGLGELGASYLLIHPTWGPWVHLRVVLSEYSFESSENTRVVNACSHCGECSRACPSGAIQEHSFDGLACRDYQREERRRLGSPQAFIYKCEVCARVCPVGTVPGHIALSDR